VCAYVHTFDQASAGPRGNGPTNKTKRKKCRGGEVPVTEKYLGVLPNNPRRGVRGLGKDQSRLEEEGESVAPGVVPKGRVKNKKSDP